MLHVQQSNEAPSSLYANRSEWSKLVELKQFCARCGAVHVCVCFLPKNMLEVLRTGAS